jgi:restriction system protein
MDRLIRIAFEMPDELEGKIKHTFYANHTKKGEFSSFGADLKFNELRQFRKLKSADIDDLRCKIETVLKSWNTSYARHKNESHASAQSRNVEEMNRELFEKTRSILNILQHRLDSSSVMNWDAMKLGDQFHVDPNELLDNVKTVPNYLTFSNDGKPENFESVANPPQPLFGDIKHEYGLFTRLFGKEKIEADYKRQLMAWEQRQSEVDKENRQRSHVLIIFNKAFEEKFRVFEKKKAKNNAAADALKQRYITGESIAIEEYCDALFAQSSYPDGIKLSWELEYRQVNRMLVVQMYLPAPDGLPDVESYKYVKSKNAIESKKLSTCERRDLYDSVLYQICLRNLYETFEADSINAIDLISFNGVVSAVNPATGVEETRVILSICTSKTEFLATNLAKVEPKAAFRHLKGISATTLYGLTPIPPVAWLDKNDRRIIEGRDVYIDTSTNLAAMHWDDFEHLVRELFEKEFSVSGGEVKVTQASSDGGVDAIAFDPDPIRGGKIVIQAKRYTNVVGVSAIRDLCGTVMNEGANKGIIVTTSDYGRDSYEFARGKPLTLLNGSNLLALLEKHGKKARIDILEAKKFAAAISR